MINGGVALVTGAARGQGRSHARTLAEHGCNILAVDICTQINSVSYPMSDEADLKETVRRVEACGVRCHGEVCDVRDRGQLGNALSSGLYGMGLPTLDYVIANAGIGPVIGEEKFAAFTDCLDVMIKGVHNTIDMAANWMRPGGAVVIIGSTTAHKALCPTWALHTHGRAGYHAAKAACVGLMHYYAHALAEKNIRVNIIHPSGVDTPMLTSATANEYYERHPDLVSAAQGLLPSGLLHPYEVTRAVLYLLESQWVTGTEMFVDAGCCA